MFHGFLDMWAEEHGLRSDDDDAMKPETVRKAVQQFKDDYRRLASKVIAQDEEKRG
ncbi:MAG TPA: hypothetical protein VGM66_08910 [Candidatus Udaeobacter sp.]